VVREADAAAPGAADNSEVRMTVEARVRCGDVMGAVGRFSDNAEALEGGVDISKLLRDALSADGLAALAIIGAGTDKCPERNALMNGLAVEKPARGS